MSDTGLHNNVPSFGTSLNKRDNMHSVSLPARIAIYDNLKSAPRVIVVAPAPTVEFIEKISSEVYSAARSLGGKIPYTVIREVSENFIHAFFNELVISVLDSGNTIRFTDQGPGIKEKEKALLPGFSSATEEMKSFIRGVGSGLPIVAEYMEVSDGLITIEDNINTGTVVTISLDKNQKEKEVVKFFPEEKTSEEKTASFVPRNEPDPIFPLSSLNPRQKILLKSLSDGNAYGVTQLAHMNSLPQSSTYSLLKDMENMGLIEKTKHQKRVLSALGFRVCRKL